MPRPCAPSSAGATGRTSTETAGDCSSHRTGVDSVIAPHAVRALGRFERRIIMLAGEVPAQSQSASGHPPTAHHFVVALARADLRSSIPRATHHRIGCVDARWSQHPQAVRESLLCQPLAPSAGAVEVVGMVLGYGTSWCRQGQAQNDTRPVAGRTPTCANAMWICVLCGRYSLRRHVILRMVGTLADRGAGERGRASDRWRRRTSATCCVDSRRPMRIQCLNGGIGWTL